MEGVAENIADQAPRGNFPDERGPPDRVRGQLHVVIAKPLETLAHAPELTELREEELNRFGNPPAGMPHDLARGVPHIAAGSLLNRSPRRALDSGPSGSRCRGTFSSTTLNVPLIPSIRWSSNRLQS